MTASKIREKILGAKDLKREKVHVEEWGCDVFVRALSLKERAEVRKASSEPDKSGELIFDPEKLESVLVITACEDEDGNKIFQKEDAPALTGHSSQIIAELSAKVLELSGMGGTRVELARRRFRK